jgi:cytochrome b561
MHPRRELTPEVYDKITIRLHWATAILVSVLWVIGRTTNFLPRGPLRLDIWSLHVLLGFTLIGVLLVRVVWRAVYGLHLQPVDAGLQHLIAWMTHGLLYLLLLVVVALGALNVFAHAFPLFGMWRFPKLGDDDFLHRINAWHGVVANIIVAVALFHAAAALFHHYVLKDAVLTRMLPRDHSESDEAGG